MRSQLPPVSPFLSTQLSSGVRRPVSTRSPARVLIDSFVDRSRSVVDTRGVDVVCTLLDVVFAARELTDCGFGKRTVTSRTDAWELSIERAGGAASLSLYRGGPVPSVLAFDERALFEDVVASVIAVSEVTVRQNKRSTPFALELASAASALHSAAEMGMTIGGEFAKNVDVVVDPDEALGLSFGSEFSMRAPLDLSDEAGAESGVERADLHALLFRGAFIVRVGERSIALDGVHPFLAAEQLLDIAMNGFESNAQHRPFFVRREVGGVRIALRIANGNSALTIGAASAVESKSAAYTFAGLKPVDVLDAAISFGRALARAILRLDRTQAANLRFGALRQRVRDATGRLREKAPSDDAKVNASPEPYRAFAKLSRIVEAPSIAAKSSAPLRYSARWKARVPAIDLRSTFLSRNALIVGTARDTFSIDRQSGAVLWQADTARATSIATPEGIARVRPNGEISLLDCATGDMRPLARVAARLGGPIVATAVYGEGLPQLLVTTEGDRYIVAVDLRTGEARWRYTCGLQGSLRLNRSGKLLYVTTGDTALTAIDVLTGAVVWRIRDRLRFRSATVVDDDALFTVSGASMSAAHIHAIDPYSGAVRWMQTIREGTSAIEGAPRVAGPAIVITVRERNALKLVAFDRADGSVRWRSSGDVAPTGTGWLSVDGLLVGHTPDGRLIAFDGESGHVRYHHNLGSVAAVDTPRRLAPVVRTGTLFVPSSDVHVFRSIDGSPLGRVGQVDLVPDLLRVDERFDVYAVEESGEIVCFGAGPRLSLVGAARTE